MHSNVSVRAQVYGAFDDLMTVDGDAPSLSLIRRGYLYMGGGPLDVRRLNQAAVIQREHGANIELLDADEIRTRWPSIERTTSTWGASHREMPSLIRMAP